MVVERCQTIFKLRELCVAVTPEVWSLHQDVEFYIKEFFEMRRAFVLPFAYVSFLNILFLMAYIYLRAYI